jgi:uncharacterized protein YdaU (DUF1376 family)
MSKPFSMPFLVEKFVKKTAHLTNEETGFYIRLLCAMWLRGGTLDDNDSDNARMMGLNMKVWLRLKQRLLPELTVYGGKLTQDRLQEQWNFAQAMRLKQSEKGKLSQKYQKERKQGLSSIRGLNNGSNSGFNTAEAYLRKKDIPIPLSTTVGFERDEHPDIDPGIPARLNTPLLRRFG